MKLISSKGIIIGNFCKVKFLNYFKWLNININIKKYNFFILKCDIKRRFYIVAMYHIGNVYFHFLTLNLSRLNAVSLTILTTFFHASIVIIFLVQDGHDFIILQ